MEKGGLSEALRSVGVRQGNLVAWADEMRLGLRGQVRRVWGIRGIKIRQRVECTYEWCYLALAVDVRGQLYWQWISNMKQEQVATVVAHWREVGIAALVWDNAPGHKAKLVSAKGVKLVGLPPYAPELNPAQRVFEELRREVEGEVYGSINNKMAAVERKLTALAADPKGVQRLVGWSWIEDALAQLPQEFTALS